MADPSRDPDTDTGVESDRAASTGTSRWQKVIGILGILVILWVGNQIVGQLTGRGGGPGGPGGDRHGPGQNGPPTQIQEQETDTKNGGDHKPPGDSK